MEKKWWGKGDKGMKNSRQMIILIYVIDESDLLLIGQQEIGDQRKGFFLSVRFMNV